MTNQLIGWIGDDSFGPKKSNKEWWIIDDAHIVDEDVVILGELTIVGGEGGIRKSMMSS